MIFLSVQDVLELHTEQNSVYGGDPGIRDHGLLESAVAQPSATFGDELLHGDLGGVAAAYLFHIAKNHAFVDGNKRTALAAALVFLDLNDAEVSWTSEEAAEITDGVAASRIDKVQLTEELRRRIVNPRARDPAAFALGAAVYAIDEHGNTITGTVAARLPDDHVEILTANGPRVFHESFVCVDLWRNLEDLP